MQRIGIDGLLLTGSNLAYTSGFANLGKTLARPSFFIMTSAGRVVLLVQEGRWYEASTHSWVEDVQTYRRLSSAPIVELRNIFDELALTGHKVGVEIGLGQLLGVPIEEFQKLRTALSPTSFVDVSALMRSARETKGKDDQQTVWAASRQVTHVLARAQLRDWVGLSLLDLQRSLVEQLLDGAEDARIRVLAHERAPDVGSTFAGAEVISSDDVLCVEMDCNVNGLWASASGILLGSDCPSQWNLLASELSALTDRLTDRVIPGQMTASLSNLGMRLLTECGDHYINAVSVMDDRMGHGLGVDVIESPYLDPGSDTILSPGMALYVRPTLHTPTGVLRTGRTIVVTEDRIERMNLRGTEVVVS